MSDKINIAPAIRFKSFDKNWSKIHFGSIFSFFTTNSFSRDKMNYTDGDVKNIHYGDIHTKYKTVLDFSKTIIPYINEDVSLSSIKDESYLIDGDVIIADASEDLKDIGKATEILNIGENKIVAGLHTILARDLTGITAVGFRGYLFSTNNARLQIQKKAQGISVLGISKSNISDIEIYLPSLEEQTKIATFLSAVDSKITSLERLVSHWQAYKKGIMQQIFTQQLRFKAPNGEDFPEWEEFQFGELFERIKRKNSIGNNNVLTISAQQGLISQTDFFNSNVASKDKSNYYLLEKGDFAYNKSYSKGYPLGAIKRLDNYENGIVSPLYICFKLNADMNSDFFVQFFDCGVLNSEIQKIAQEGARNHGLLNISITEMFTEIFVLIPSKEEQTKIANFLSSLDDKIAHLQQQLTSYRQFKKALLQQMFV